MINDFAKEHFEIGMVTIQNNICELIRERYPERFSEVQKDIMLQAVLYLALLANSSRY